MNTTEQNKATARRVFDGKRILITGGTGSLGQVLIRRLMSGEEAVQSGLFSREQLHAEIHELLSGAKKGRERDDERILIHTCGLVSQDVALAHFLYRNALGKGLGLWLPRAPM